MNHWALDNPFRSPAPLISLLDSWVTEEVFAVLSPTESPYVVIVYPPISYTELYYNIPLNPSLIMKARNVNLRIYDDTPSFSQRNCAVAKLCDFANHILVEWLFSSHCC